MSDADRAVEDAEQTVAEAQARYDADVHSAYWSRLKEHGIPPRLRDEWTYAKFFGVTAVSVEWDDGE